MGAKNYWHNMRTSNVQFVILARKGGRSHTHLNNKRDYLHNKSDETGRLVPKQLPAQHLECSIRRITVWQEAETEDNLVLSDLTQPA